VWTGVDSHFVVTEQDDYMVTAAETYSASQVAEAIGYGRATNTVVLNCQSG